MTEHTDTSVSTVAASSSEAQTGLKTALEKSVSFFENLSPARLPDIDNLYSADAFFKDPFNEVKGASAIRDIFAHMYVALNDPRFEVTSRFGEGSEAFIAWNFIFRFKDTRPQEWQCVRGSSHLRFNDAGQIVYHRDYWDAAEELYEKIPVLGGLMRWIKKKAAG